MYMKDLMMCVDFYSKYGSNIKYCIVDDEKNKLLTKVVYNY